jgi:hypothetical protein
MSGVLNSGEAAKFEWRVQPRRRSRVASAPFNVADMLSVMLGWPCLALLGASPGSSARRRPSTSAISMATRQSEPGYAVLGVQPGASRAELKAAYRERAKKCHPDVNSTHAAAQEFRMLTEVSCATLDTPLQHSLSSHSPVPTAQAFERLTSGKSSPPRPTASKSSPQQRADGRASPRESAVAAARAAAARATARAAKDSRFSYQSTAAPSPFSRSPLSRPREAAAAATRAAEEDLFWSTWTYDAASSPFATAPPSSSSSSSASPDSPADSPADLFNKKHGAPVAARRAAQAAAWAARAAASPEVEIGAESHWSTAAPRAEDGEDSAAAKATSRAKAAEAETRAAERMAAVAREAAAAAEAKRAAAEGRLAAAERRATAAEGRAAEAEAQAARRAAVELESARGEHASAMAATRAAEELEEQVAMLPAALLRPRHLPPQPILCRSPQIEMPTGRGHG